MNNNKCELKRIKSNFINPILLGILMSINGQVLAAETEQKTEEAAKENDLEVIMVTARKRTESIYEVPTSITSMGAEEMEKANISNLDDIGKYVPNLNISRYGGGNSAHAAVFIRGIGLQDHVITTDPGVGVYVDGVYLGRQMGANLSLPNIERVEVLRGPQGTLYGRNSLGGAVNVITKKPGDEDVFSVTGQVGSRGRFLGELYYNQQVSDDFSLSASTSYKVRNGVGKAVNLSDPEREIGEEEELSARLAAKWQVNTDLSLLLSFDTVDNESGQSPYTIEFTEPVDSTNAFNGDFHLLTPNLIPDNPDDLGTTVAGLESTASSGWGASLTADWTIDDSLSAKFIASVRNSEYEGGLDDDGSALNLSEFPETGGADQYSFELQVNGTYEGYDFVSGLYYFNEDGFTESGPYVFSPFNTPDGVLNDGINASFGKYGYFDLNQETNAYAAYVNVYYDVSEAFTLGGGLRYSKDEKEANAHFPTFDFLPPALGRKFVEANFSAITWDFNASYAFSNIYNVYGQIQKGYQTGGFPPRPFGGADQFVQFDETTAINYEIGFKGQPTNDLSLLVALFITQYKDLALPFSDPTAGGGFVTIVENAGRSEAKGIEIEATYDVTDNFRIKAAIGYLNAEITEVEDGVLGIAEGDSPALTPKWTFMFAPSYYVDLDDGEVISISADYSFRDEMQGQSKFNANEQIDSRELVGFNVKYQSAKGDWSLSLYGQNVFNEVYDQGRLQQPGYVGIVRSNDRSEFGLKYNKIFDL